MQYESVRKGSRCIKVEQTKWRKDVKSEEECGGAAKQDSERRRSNGPASCGTIAGRIMMRPYTLPTLRRGESSCALALAEGEPVRTNVDI